MEPAPGPLSAELTFFESQLEEWLRHHEGKFALVKGNQLVGIFDTAEAAYTEGLAKVGNVPMLVRQVVREQPVHSAPALLHGLLHGHS